MEVSRAVVELKNLANRICVFVWDEVLIHNRKARRDRAGDHLALGHLVVLNLAYPLTRVLSLELCDGHHLVDDEPTLRSGGVVDWFPDRKPVHVMAVEGILQVEVVPDRPIQPIQLGDDDQVDPAVLYIREKPLQFVPVIPRP